MPRPFSLASECMRRVRACWPAPGGLPEPVQRLRQQVQQQWQRRATLFVNHVLMQHPQAMQRLQPHAGRVVALRWRGMALHWQITPAGLLEAAPGDAALDLRLDMTERSPLVLARQALLHDRPHIHISGDARLAGDIGFLLEHVRWDAQGDLAHWIGERPARALARAVRRVAAALRRFVRTRLNAPVSESSTASAPLALALAAGSAALRDAMDSSAP